MTMRYRIRSPRALTDPERYPNPGRNLLPRLLSRVQDGGVALGADVWRLERRPVLRARLEVAVARRFALHGA